jgi:hypothetical protein
LYCKFCYLRPVSCAQCCQFLWIFHSWRSLRFSLTFIPHRVKTCWTPLCARKYKWHKYDMNPETRSFLYYHIWFEYINVQQLRDILHICL